MVVERLPVVILPSGRVPGRVLLALPILEARRRRNRDEIAKKGSVLEGFGTRVKYRPKGGISGGLGVGERSNFKKFPTHTQDHGDA